MLHAMRSRQDLHFHFLDPHPRHQLQRLTNQQLHCLLPRLSLLFLGDLVTSLSWFT